MGKLLPIRALFRSPTWFWTPIALAGLLGGCALFPPPTPDPVAADNPPLPVELPRVVAVPVPLSESRPMQYKVKPGDSLIRIGSDLGYNWRDIARLNKIKQPYPLQVGKVLKLPELPTGNVGAVSASSPHQEPLSELHLVPSSSTSITPVPPVSLSDKQTAQTTTFQWPGGKSVIENFAATGKGIDIDGQPGDPVRAAADGRVVYAGSALPGYGKIVILKHESGYLSAYGHNQQLIATEGSIVQRGDVIATMGSSGAERVKLRFEIRHNGIPVDPLAYLISVPLAN